MGAWVHLVIYQIKYLCYSYWFISAVFTSQAVLHTHHLSEHGASAVQGNGTIHNASFALDGTPVFDLNSTQCSKTTEERGSWMRVDLKKEYRVYAIRAVSGWSHVRARVGNNETTNTDVNGQCGPEAVGSTNTWHTFVCNGTGISGRYINMITYTDSGLVVCELDLFYGKLCLSLWDYLGYFLVHISVVMQHWRSKFLTAEKTWLLPASCTWRKVKASLIHLTVELIHWKLPHFPPWTLHGRCQMALTFLKRQQALVESPKKLNQ